ncbi:MAG: hypothetical protein IJV01_06280 [Bacteroidales bacterium]|nr:hypothetical protein [Bacteroidales bacterium]
MFLTALLQSSAAALLLSLSQPNGDCVPDFSRVGYHWGDDPLPKVKVVKKLSPPADGADATPLIQEAVDAMTGPGAILLRAGTWKLSGSVRIGKSGVVLRGEGEGKTILYGSSRTQYDLVVFGKLEPRMLDKEARARVLGDYVPVGQMFVDVDHSEHFQKGDCVYLFRPGTPEWLHAIRADRMQQHHADVGIVVRQWQPAEFNLYWERKVMKVEGNRIWLDNPVVLALEKRFGGGRLIKGSRERICECGLEQLTLDCSYNPAILDAQGRCIDENHAWSGVSFYAVEHSWVRNVTALHFGYGLVHLHEGAKNITVKDCTNLDPVSRVRGQRRYGYCLNRCELCLVESCSSDRDRHGPVTQARTCGPNVFLDFTMTGALNDAGPHYKLAQGTLYDCVHTDGELNVQDRDGGGYGHGWAGVNIWLWNCEARSIACQDQWDVAHNYAVGCIADKGCGFFGQGAHEYWMKRHGYYPGHVKDFEERPDGVWVSQGRHVEPASLYRYQLEQRRKAGIRIAEKRRKGK